jgi:hypothetical protein
MFGNNNQLSHIGLEGDDMMNALTLIEALNEMTQKEINALDETPRSIIREMTLEEWNMLSEEAQQRIANMPLTEEQLEARNQELQLLSERHRLSRLNNVEYIISGNFTPAAPDINLQTIERFVFITGDVFGGHGFVLDRTHSRVHFEPQAGSHGRLALGLHAGNSASLIDEDLVRLIQMIEESGLRDWDEHYRGRTSEYILDGRVTWDIGIKFADGTILRRGGSGISTFNDFFPPQDQWSILIDFISTIGAEIQERHAAEAVIQRLLYGGWCVEGLECQIQKGRQDVMFALSETGIFSRARAA